MGPPPSTGASSASSTSTSKPAQTSSNGWGAPPVAQPAQPATTTTNGWGAPAANGPATPPTGPRSTHDSRPPSKNPSTDGAARPPVIIGAAPRKSEPLPQAPVDPRAHLYGLATSRWARKSSMPSRPYAGAEGSAPQPDGGLSWSTPAPAQPVGTQDASSWGAPAPAAEVKPVQDLGAWGLPSAQPAVTDVAPPAAAATSSAWDATPTADKPADPSSGWVTAEAPSARAITPTPTTAPAQPSGWGTPTGQASSTPTATPDSARMTNTDEPTTPGLAEPIKPSTGGLSWSIKGRSQRAAPSSNTSVHSTEVKVSNAELDQAFGNGSSTPQNGNLISVDGPNVAKLSIKEPATRKTSQQLLTEVLAQDGLDF